MTKLGLQWFGPTQSYSCTHSRRLYSLVAIGAAISGSVGLDAIASNPECVGDECGGELVFAHMAIWFVFYMLVSVITVFWNAAI